MEIVKQIQNLQRSYVVAGLFVAWLTYLVVLTTYRLYFSPLAKFPGPKLAAISKWYEFYYEVLLKGRFTFKIQELHKIYGKKIIRLIGARSEIYANSRLSIIVLLRSHCEDYPR
jgi:hypothetical protein